MEGPTPVSALIHAATMVTAGVYLMVRVNPVLEAAADWAPQTIAWIGALTALFAATIAVAQNDIKKVLAYSTVSQLGFMFLAVGSGAYVAALFHMVTHASFKALLFLGAGSVIHGMHDRQDMRGMGALRKLMPVTAITFIIGWLAISGVPPFAGFCSKDEILLFALADNTYLYVIAVFTALLTAFYMTRQVIMVFFGEARWESKAEEHGARGEFEPHESPAIMTVPLVVLAGLTIVGGLIQLPTFGWIPGRAQHQLEHWTEPVLEAAEREIAGTWAFGHQSLLIAIAVASSLVGIGLAWLVYQRKKIKAVEPLVMAEGWYYDQTVSAFMGGPGRKMFDAVAWFDKNVVDGAVNGVAKLVGAAAGEARKTQTGNVRNYAGILGVGVVLLLAWFVIGIGLL
jgi:NADH-quinone oxidoreductase subunit L